MSSGSDSLEYKKHYLKQNKPIDRTKQTHSQNNERKNKITLVTKTIYFKNEAKYLRHFKVTQMANKDIKSSLMFLAIVKCKLKP